MASGALTTSLPTETDSKQRYIAPAPATPSALTSIFDFATNIAGVADRAVTSLQNTAAKKNAAADQQAKNDSIKRLATGLFSDPSMAPQPNIPPGSEAAYSNSQPLATQAANTQTAAQQGKIDPSMAQAKSLAVFRQALAANPGHEYAVFQAFKEAGVDNMMMQQYNNAEKMTESDQNAQADARHALEKDAVTKWGFTNYYQMDEGQKAVTLATVGNLNANEAEVDAKAKLADLTLKNVQLTDSQRTQVQKQASTGLASSALNYMTASYANLSKIMVNQLGDSSLQAQPGRLEQLQSHLMNVALPAMDAQYNIKMAQIAPYLTPEDRSMLDSSYKQQRQSLVDMISGPQSVVEMNKRVLSNITDKFNIDYAKAFPTLMKLQKIVGPQTIGVLLSPSINANPQLMDLLTKELNGVITDPSKMPSFTELVETLNGTVDPSTWDPEKMKALAPASLASTIKLASDTVSSNGTDKDSHKALVNSIKQTAGIALDVVPQWGFSNIVTQGRALNNPGVVRALFHTGSINQPEKIDAIHNWIPATTRTYLALTESNAGDRYYTPKLDPHTLQWKAVWNGQRVPNKMQAVPGMEMPVQTGSVVPKPSSAVLNQVATLNTMLNNLSVVGSKGYDDTIKGANYTEARRYFATGEPPASLQKSNATGKNGKTPEQNVDDAISHMLDFVNKLPTPKDEPISNKKIGSSPYAEAIGTSATKYGVPPAIAAALFGTETSGGKNTKDSSKGAVGVGQIMPTTAASYGVSDLRSLTPEGNIDLAMHILSDNFKKTGSWEDALSMYHSGVDLATARAQGRNDGHMKTTDYVASTMAAASSISPENLKRYGYVRY